MLQEGIKKPPGPGQDTYFMPWSEGGGVSGSCCCLVRVWARRCCCHLLVPDTMLSYASSPCPPGGIHPVHICRIGHAGITNTQGTVLPRGCLHKTQLPPQPSFPSPPQSACTRLSAGDAAAAAMLGLYNAAWPR